MNPLLFIYIWLVLISILVLSHRYSLLSLMVLVEVLVVMSAITLVFKFDISTLLVYFVIVVSSSAVLVTLLISSFRMSSASMKSLTSVH